MTFVEALGQELDARNLTKRDFAAQVKIPAGTVYTWFSGRAAAPSVELARKAATGLNTTIESLIDKYTPGHQQPKSTIRRRLDEFLDQLEDADLRVLLGTAKVMLEEHHSQELQRDSGS